MQRYHNTLESARVAIAERRKKVRAESEILSRDLIRAIVAEGGKVAEVSEPQKRLLAHVEKAFEALLENRCPVDPPTTPQTPNQTLPIDTPYQALSNKALATLLKSPDVQSRIATGRAQRRREEARAATLAKRLAVPSITWKKATPNDKLRFAGHAAAAHGGLAFSLNLSGTLQRKLKMHADPVRAFTDILNRKLKSFGLSGTPYALSLEMSAAGELHVHGFALVAEGSRKALSDSLRAAGGLIPGRKGSRQLTLRKMSEGVAWASYCQKDIERTDSFLEGKARCFLNRPMTQMAHEFAP